MSAAGPVVDLRDPAADLRDVDVLVPTRDRPAELAATLAGLAAQGGGFRVVVSDQSDGDVPAWGAPAAQAMVRVLRAQGHRVELARHLPRRGLAEHRAFLLGRSTARYVLFLDDDVWLEAGVLARLRAAIGSLGCGFVGAFPQGMSYLDDVRPTQTAVYEEWDGPPVPEHVGPGTPAMERWTLHRAANMSHVAARLRLAPGEWRAYKVAWVGGCVLYDRAALVESGGFDFWVDLPAAHAGEDVVAQWRVMARRGGAGIVPSGAVHLEAPTTIPDREVDAHHHLARSALAAIA